MIDLLKKIGNYLNSSISGYHSPFEHISRNKKVERLTIKGNDFCDKGGN